MIDLNEIAEQCAKYSEMRVENGARIDIDPLKHCAGELFEAVDAREYFNLIRHFKSVSISEKTTLEEAKNSYADELMDAMYCLLLACHKDGIDVEKSLLKNIDKNRKRALCIGDKK